jgi:hypothetical protein
MNLIKSIYSHTFDNPLAMANASFITIAIIFTFIFIVGEFFVLNRDYLDKITQYVRCFKSVKGAYHNTVDILKYLGEQILYSICVYVVLFGISLALFIISTIWVEYPGYYGVVYTKDGGQWNKHEGRVHHFPFGFDGCTVSKRDHSGTISLGDVFKIQYHINESDGSMRTVLKNLDSITTSMIFQDIERLIRNRYKGLIFYTDYKDLISPEIRLKIFQDFYAPYGVTIDSVERL